MKKIYTILFVSVFFSFISCSEKNKENSNNHFSQNEINRTYRIAQTNYSQILVYTKYDIPLPVDLYRKMKKNNLKFKRDLPNTVNNVNRYITSAQKSMALGFYTSDLAYTTIFAQQQMSMDYFNVTKILAEDLEIGNGYDEEMVQRAYDNIENNDSLKLFAEKAYWETCNYLEENDNINTLPFIVVGGWIESLYLAFYSDDLSNPDPEIMQEIVNQGKTIDNIIDYLFEVMVESNAYYANVEIQKLINKLRALKKIYSDIDTNNKNFITLEDYLKIGEEIKKIRNFYLT